MGWPLVEMGEREGERGEGEGERGEGEGGERGCYYWFVFQL